MAQLRDTFLLMRLQKGLRHDVLDKMERVEGNILTDNHLESFIYSSLLSYRVWTLRGAGNNFTFTQCAVCRRDSDRKKPATLSLKQFYARSSWLVGGLRCTEAGRCMKATITHSMGN